MVVYGNEDGKASDADADGENREEEAMLEAVGNEGDDHTEAEGSGPGRYGVQLGLNGGVAVTLDDGGAEVCVTVRGDDQAEIHEATDDDFEVFEDVANVFGGDRAFAGGFALVDLESGLHVGALVFGEPFRLLREIGQQEEEEAGYDDGQESLQDKNPAPSFVSTHAVHLADRGGEKAAECPGKGRRREEEGVSLLRFVAAVPHTDEIEGTREHASLKYAQEKASCEETSVVGDETLDHGDKAEAKHAY